MVSGGGLERGSTGGDFVAAAPVAPNPSKKLTAAPVRRPPAGMSPCAASMEARLTPVAVTPHPASIPAVNELIVSTARSVPDGPTDATRRRAVSAKAAIAARATWADQYLPVLTNGAHTAVLAKAAASGHPAERIRSLSRRARLPCRAAYPTEPAKVGTQMAKVYGALSEPLRG